MADTGAPEDESVPTQAVVGSVFRGAAVGGCEAKAVNHGVQTGCDSGPEKGPSGVLSFVFFETLAPRMRTIFWLLRVFSDAAGGLAINVTRRGEEGFDRGSSEGG